MPNIALITGASAGIGREFARYHAEKGGDLIITARRAEALDALKAELEDQHGISVTTVPLDLGADGGADQLYAAVKGHQIDVLINNAGIIGPTSEKQTPLSMDWDGAANTFAINSIAPLAVAQAALPALRRSKQPRILTVSSQMASFARPKSSQIAYRASKAAVNKVMQGLAVELRPEGIPVAVINPGWVRTDMGGPRADEDPKDVAQGILTIMDRLTIEDTGKFFRFTGEEFAY